MLGKMLIGAAALLTGLSTADAAVTYTLTLPSGAGGSTFATFTYRSDSGFITTRQIVQASELSSCSVEPAPATCSYQEFIPDTTGFTRPRETDNYDVIDYGYILAPDAPRGDNYVYFANAAFVTIGEYDAYTSNGFLPSGHLSVTSDAASAVPEPLSWAMMAAGFGLVGGVLRRRAPLRANAG